MNQKRRENATHFQLIIIKANENHNKNSFCWKIAVLLVIDNYFGRFHQLGYGKQNFSRARGTQRSKENDEQFFDFHYSFTARMNKSQTSVKQWNLTKTRHHFAYLKMCSNKKYPPIQCGFSYSAHIHTSSTKKTTFLLEIVFWKYSVFFFIFSMSYRDWYFTCSMYILMWSSEKSQQKSKYKVMTSEKEKENYR